MTLREEVEKLRDELYLRSGCNYDVAASSYDQLIAVEHRSLAHLEEVIADKLTDILSNTIEQPNTYPSNQESNMATKNTVKSLASDKTYFAFVLEVRGDEKFVLGNTENGIVRAPTTLELPAGLELADGLHVFQGKANGTFNSHVQYKGEKGNREYGWAFETADPAVRTLVG